MFEAPPGLKAAFQTAFQLGQEAAKAPKRSQPKAEAKSQCLLREITHLLESRKAHLGFLQGMLPTPMLGGSGPPAQKQSAPQSLFTTEWQPNVVTTVKRSGVPASPEERETKAAGSSRTEA